MNYLLTSLFSFSLFSCSSAKVRDSDLKSWKGQEINTLETHKMFSALPKEERLITNSEDKLINYYQRKTVENGSRNCFGTGVGFGGFRGAGFGLGSSMCSPREIEDNSCTHQFTVNNNTIKDYRVLGRDCFTDCDYRPTGKCPKGEK